MDKKYSPSLRHGRAQLSQMTLCLARCRVCKGDQFKEVRPEGWIEKYLLPRFLICPGRCLGCQRRRYLPMFQRWTTSRP